MAIRISNPPLDDTTKLVEVIMTNAADNNRVLFLVPAGQAGNVLARIRTMISRKRKALEQRGKKIKRFTLNSTVHRETHEGIRYDAIIMWRTVSDSHIMMETLEDLLSNG